MRNGIFLGLGIVVLIAAWSDIIAAIGALISVVGIIIVYATLLACVIGFIAMILGFDGESASNLDGEPVYRG